MINQGLRLDILLQSERKLGDDRRAFHLLHTQRRQRKDSAGSLARILSTTSSGRLLQILVSILGPLLDTSIDVQDAAESPLQCSGRSNYFKSPNTTAILEEKPLQATVCTIYGSPKSEQLLLQSSKPNLESTTVR